MFMAVGFTTAKTWKPPKSPTDEWISMWVIHTVEYYVALKKKEVLLLVGAWTGLEDIVCRCRNADSAQSL